MTPLYDAMCSALAAAEEVFADIERLDGPAQKLQAYARIAQNLELERQASEIRIRAERGLMRGLKTAFKDHRFSQPTPPKTGSFDPTQEPV
jgi:hypothetical protein